MESLLFIFCVKTQHLENVKGIDEYFLLRIIAREVGDMGKPIIKNAPQVFHGNIDGHHKIV